MKIQTVLAEDGVTQVELVTMESDDDVDPTAEELDSFSLLKSAEERQRMEEER